MIVSAVIAPTAMDIERELKFELDREMGSYGTRVFENAGELPGPVRDFHQTKIRCFMDPSRQGCGEKELKLSKIVGDQP